MNRRRTSRAYAAFLADGFRNSSAQRSDHSWR
ncbi:hypothetical protein GGE06_006150 [Streptomyces sp. SFB5A]|jgi:hypothetical protein|uniref:Uncharacterized protein n=1 Tax=Streptomyces nymphaeiformis TaxID=2663842 RepID=A0A7W7U7R5_9ACTN|nr:hypothetical protein [Streptomyces nymphaeiformis]